MGDKRPYTKLTKEEEAVFGKYLDEFLNAGFRSPQRKDIIDRTFDELRLTNPNIKREQVHNKYNNLLSNHKNKNKQSSNDTKSQISNTYNNAQPTVQPPPPPPPPPPTINAPSNSMMPTMTNIIPQQQTAQIQPYQMAQSLQRYDSPLLPTRQDSLMGSFPFFSFGDGSANNSQQPSRTSSNAFDPFSNASAQYFAPTNSDDFMFHLSSTPSFIHSSLPVQQSLDFTSDSYEVPKKIENCTKEKLYSWLPKIQEETDFTSPDCPKELYDKIKDICLALYNSQFVFKYDEIYDSQGIIFYDKDKLDFLQKAEESFIEITNLFVTKLKTDYIHPQCSCCENVAPQLKNITTRSRRSYNSPQVSSEPSRTNSFAGKTSADLYKQKGETGNTENDKKESEIRNKIDTSLQPLFVSQFSKLIAFRSLHLNEKLLSFFTGEFNEDNYGSFQFGKSECSTLISFNLDLKEPDNQFLFCHPAFIYCNEKKSHILHFNGVEIETGFFLPSTSMIFYRESGINRLYACGDKRVKEFTISGLDQYIIDCYTGSTHPIYWNKTNDPDETLFRKAIKIENTNTFYIGDGDYQTTVITIWKGQLVVGCDSIIHFWPIEGVSNTKMIDQKENKDKAAESGIDLNEVDWTRGKLENENGIEIKEMPKISSFSIIEKSESNSYLAVASFQYPVIYVFNEDHQIVSRLISHTMGITSLKSYNFKLFSSSLDRTARIWYLNQDETMTFFDTQSQRITEIEIGIYFDQMVLFIGMEGNIVQCWSVTNKKLLFEIELLPNYIPKKITFLSGKNQVHGDFARLIVLSEQIDANGYKNFLTQSFEFI